MKALTELVRRVIAGTITPTQVIDEVRAMAPKSAKWNRSHGWWATDGEAILDTIISVSKGKFLLSPQAAVAQAMRSNGKVVIDRVAGIQLYRVVERVEEKTVELILNAAMPSEFVEPTWDSELPTLARFRSCAEVEYLRRLLTKNDWNISASARESGVARQTLYALLKEHRLARPGFTNETSTNTDVAEAA